MKYMGSKSRIKKEIVPIIQGFITEDTTAYIEPFVGGCNVIDTISHNIKIGSDNNKYLIDLHKEAKQGINFPTYISKEHYSEVREAYKNNTDKFPNWYIGLVGFLASYNGRFFDGGYAKTITTSKGTIRNYYDEAKRNYIEQIPYITDIEFRYCDYSYYTTDNTKGAVIYCDIPYANVKQYATSRNFDYLKFWNWVRTMSTCNIVIVSELQAPNDFKCIYEQATTRTVDNTKRVNSVEKLFILDI